MLWMQENGGTSSGMRSHNVRRNILCFLLWNNVLIDILWSSCICGAEFCYRCGAVWKECSCGDWGPELLELRAEQVVDREAPHFLPVAERQIRVRAMEQRLERNHECQHHGRWQRRDDFRRRGYVCDFCSDRHWKYILACRHCHVIACESCRRHRV